MKSPPDMDSRWPRNWSTRWAGRSGARAGSGTARDSRSDCPGTAKISKHQVVDPPDPRATDYEPTLAWRVTVFRMTHLGPIRIAQRAYVQGPSRQTRR